MVKTRNNHCNGQASNTQASNTQANNASHNKSHMEQLLATQNQLMQAVL
jgi:hypothetical protein